MQVFLYDEADLSAPIATATTDAQGYVIFHNLDTRKNYKLVGADEPSGNFTTPSLTGVVAKADSFELYALQYKSNKGSFMLGKSFVGPDGNAITVSNFEATFQLYTTGGVAVGDPIKVTSKTAAVVQQLYSAGTYVLKEVGLKINGADASDQYTLFGGNTARVTIVAGEYGTKPVDTGSENRVDANGVFLNKSAYGQLKIKNYAFNGDGLKGFTYTVTDVNGVIAPVTVAMTSAESEKTILLPAGTYKVTQTLKSGYMLLTANEKQVTVTGGTPVTDTITIDGLQNKEVRILVGEDRAVQAVAFINAVLPSVSGKKIRKDNNADVSGAQFALYVKDGSNYVPYMSGSTQVEASSNSSGVFSFASLPAGDYAFVETVVPAGYSTPAYRAAFYEADGTTLKTSVPAASISSAPKFSVTYNDYSHQASTVNLANNEENVRYASVTINMGTTDKAIAYVSGSTFTLYNSNNEAIGTASPTNSGFVKFYDTASKELQLAPGTYTVKQTGMTGNAAKYVMRDDVVTVTVSPEGGIEATFAPNMTTTYKNSVITSDIANNAVKITFTNVLKPSVKFSKRGETNVFDDKGSRTQTALAGAKFVVQFVKDTTTYYAQFDSSFVMTGVTTDRAAATELVSNQYGEVFVNYLDPLQSEAYKLVEISAPLVKDTDLEYKLGKWSIDLQLVTDADSTYYHLDISGASTNDNGYSVITNKVDPHHLMITKYGLQVDAQGKVTEVNTTYAINGVFNVYRWDEGKGAYDMSKPVDIMKAGSGGIDNANTAFSRQLPAGKYLVVEVQAPIGSVSVGATNAALYVKENGQWVKKSSFAEDGKLQFEVVLSQDEEVTNVDVGNIAQSGGSTASYARLYGEKVGYAMDIDGNLTLQGPIMGVNFDVYLGYVDNTTGAYIKLTDTPYETVKSGSVSKDGKLQPGQFLTSFIAKSQFVAAATAANVDEADIKNYAFILVEKGPLPGNYRPIGDSATPEFGYSIDFDVNYLQTIGANGSETTPVEVRNVAGEGFLRIRKYGQTNTTTPLTGAEFELYSATTANASESEWQYVGKVNPTADQVASTYSLLPGYYFIKEVTAEVGYNTYGQYRVDGGTRKDFDGVIGSIALHDGDTVILDVYDKEYASLQLQNYWNGGSDTNVDATYKIEYVDGTNTYATNQVLVSANTAKTISGLPDGTYKITEMPLSGTKAEEYLVNTAASTYGIEVVVAKGVITSIKTNGEDIKRESFKDSKYDIACASDKSKVEINHKSKGALIIQKGYINASGVASNSVPSTLTQAVFNIEKYNTSSSSYISAGTITWTNADATNGKKVLLATGSYRITETSSSAGYLVDATPVYVDIADTGAVYLKNNSAKYGVVSSKDAPLNASNSSAKAYFYNPLNMGTLQIYKANSASSTTYLSGATFEIYTSPTGEAASKVNATFTASNGVYSTELAPGTYYIKEVTAPNGYDVREELFEVTVTANTAPVYKGYENTANANTICILNAALVSITVEKTTTYPSIDDGKGGVLLPETEARVAGMPIQLYKYNGTTYELVKDTATVFGSANVHGTVNLTGLGVGKYKIVEFSPADGSLDYLNLNQKYNLANIDTAPVIEIKYDAATNTLVVDASAVGSDYNASTRMLTIDNEFIGVRFAAKKLDIETGEPVANAVFELYENYDPATGAVSGKVSSSTITYKTDATGVVYFDPMYLQTGTTYYVKEVNVPGYIIDAYYDTDVKAVTASRENTQVLATFKNKKMPVDPVLTVVKSTDAVPGNPLRDEGFDATYTIAQTALGLNNALPLFNYTVKDNGPQFYGKNINDGDVLVAEVSGHKPGYTITNVKVYPATAKLSYDAAATAVYANVNGTGWKLLAAPYTEFAVDADATGIEVVYASTIPGEGEMAVVGTSFLPGKIEVDVTYDRFEPLNATQPEVTKIVNTATINANYRDITKGGDVLKALKQATSEETIELSVKERPKMDVEKTLLTDVIKGPGETLEYKLTLTNKSTATGSGDESHLDIVDPAIIDVMQENVLFASVDGNGKPIYTVSGDASGADVSACNMYEGGRIVEWKFAGLRLAPGESIEITYTAQLAAVIGGSTVDNAAYGTSSALLSYSTKYPTGAMFTSFNPAKAVSEGAEYDLLQGHTGISGLYVKATKNDVKIKRSGQVNAQRSISTDGSSWVSSSDIALDVYPGDTIYYRLQVQNDGTDNAPSLEKIRIADILPFLGDSKFTSGSRGTQWSDELTNLWKISSDISISNTAGAVSDYSVKYSAARALAGINSGGSVSKEDANSFMITFGEGFKLEKSDTLTIVFSMKLPDYADFTDSMLQDNVRKTAVASFLPIFEYLGSEFNNGESNTVKARLLLPKVNVSGKVWDDTNRDGVMDAGEQPLSGVPVSLMVSTDSGKTFSQVGQTINSGADGSYQFTGLESSYGEGAPVYKVVFENAHSATKQFSPGVVFGGASSADDKSHVVNVSVDKTKGDTGAIQILTNSVVNAGINGIPSYNVTYAPGAADSDATSIPVYSAALDSVLQGGTYTVRGGNPTPAWPGSGYSFDGWTVTTDVSGSLNTTAGYYGPAGTFTMPGNDVVLTAKWKENTKYTVSYTAGTDVTNAQNIPASDSVATGKLYSVKGAGGAGDLTPTRPGYTFAGWTVIEDSSSTLTTTTGYYKPGTGTGSFTMPSNNVKLAANWTVNYWTVTYALEGSPSGMPSPATVTNIQALTTFNVASTEPTRYGFAFKGWKVTSGKATGMQDVYQASGSFTMPDNNVVLTAQWVPTYQVTYDGDGAQSGVPIDNAWYEAADVVTVESGTPVKEGFAFKGWKVTSDASGVILDDVYQNPDTFVMPANHVTLTAQWAPTYTVTYSALAATNIPTDNDRYEAGATYTIKTGTPIKEGFTFTGWSADFDNNIYQTTGTNSFTMPAQDVVLTETWTENYWKVTYESENDTTGMPNPSVVEDVLALSTFNVASSQPARFGFNFKGWKVTSGKGGTMVDVYQAGGSFTMPDNDVVLTAQWVPTYTVKYIASDATGVPTDTARYEATDTVNVKNGTPIKEGFTFAGWVTNFDSNTYQGGQSFTMPAKNVELTATWTENYWTVTYISENDTTGMPNPSVVEDVLALSTFDIASDEPARFGFNFKGWQVTSGKSAIMENSYQADESFTMPDNDVELTAIWEPTYTVTYDGLGATSGVPTDDARYEQGDEVVVKDGTPLRAGYAFKGWLADFDGATYAAGEDFAMPGDDVVLTAIWAPTYTVTYNGNGATSGVPSDTNRYEVGDTVTVLNGIPVRANYVFKGWRSSTDSTNYAAGNTFAMPNGNVVLTAIWEPTYTVTYDGNGATSGVPSDNTRYEVGDTATVASGTPVRAGYTFNGWLYNGTVYQAGQTIVMPNGNVVLVAQWTAIPTPSPSPSPSGSVDPSPSPSGSPSPSSSPSVVPSPSGSTEPTASANPVVDIENPETPLFGAGNYYWSLLSLLMSLAGLVIAILIFVSMFKRHKKDDADENEYMADEEEEEPRKKRSKLLKAFVSIMGVLVGIVWLILDNLRLPMAFINGYTIYVAIAFLVTIVLLIVERSVKKKDKDDEEEEEAKHLA